MNFFRTLLRGGMLAALAILAAGGILTSTHYAVVFRLSVGAAISVFVVALIGVLVRALVQRARPRGFATTFWAGFAGGLVTMGLLTLSGPARLFVVAWVVVAVVTFVGDWGSGRVNGATH
jgi:hypothetical protein